MGSKRGIFQELCIVQPPKKRWKGRLLEFNMPMIFNQIVSPEAAGLGTTDPDPVSLTVIPYLLLCDAIPGSDGECFIAGDCGSDAGVLKRLCDLICVHTSGSPVFLE